uniref:Uncharacterized protein n=1 Tax=Hyaloperonospora arabidopsidis (strain Emoy2) TaxID=559515 RepID=M4BFG8_HYAAE
MWSFCNAGLPLTSWKPLRGQNLTEPLVLRGECNFVQKYATVNVRLKPLCWWWTVSFDTSKFGERLLDAISRAVPWLSLLSSVIFHLNGKASRAGVVKQLPIAKFERNMRYLVPVSGWTRRD